MRKITLVYSDYSDGPIHGWTKYFEGFLINPRLVLEAEGMGILFHLFDEPINDDQEMLSTNKSTTYELDLHESKKQLTQLDIEKLAHMTVWELGEFITGTSK